MSEPAPATSPAPTSSADLWWAIGLMLLVQVLVSLSALAGPVLVPLAAADLGVKPHEVGFLISLLYGAASLSALLSGIPIGRLGAVRTSQCSLILVATALLLGASGDITAILCAALILGLGYGPVTPASSHILARLAPPARRNLIFSLKQTGVPIGNGLAGLTLPLLGLALGWQAGLVATAALIGCVALALQPWRARFDKDRGAGPRRGLLASLVEPARLILRDRALLRLTIASFGFAATQASIGTFLVAALTTNTTMAVVAAGIVLSSAQAGGAIGRVTWGVIADRSRRALLTLVLLAFAMGTSIMLLGGVREGWDHAVIIGLAIVSGATAIGWNGVYLAEIARLSPGSAVADITGVTSMVTFAGVLVVPSLVTLVVGATGSYALGFAIPGLLALLGGALCAPLLFPRVRS